MKTHQVTALLQQVKLGDKNQLNKVYSLLYKDIKAIAGYQLKMLNTGQTITPTVLAHECYLKLYLSEQLSISNKRHFMKCLAKSMRMYLIDSLRAKSSQKRKGIQVGEGMTEYVGDEDVNFKLLDIDLMIDKVELIDAKLAEILHYKLIFNLTYKEIGDLIEMSERQVIRLWKQAKALLMALMKSD